MFRDKTVPVTGGVIHTSVYYVPGIIALGVIQAAVSNLGVSVTTQRESGILKRRRATPVSAGVLITSRALTAATVALAMTGVLAAIGWFAYGAHIPAGHAAALIVTVLAGAVQGVQQLDSEIPPAQIVTRQSFTLADLAATRLLPQVQAAQAAGAQVLVLDTLAPAATALVLLDAASIGYHPQVLDTFRLSADPATVGGLIRQFSGGKASPALENGLITQDYLPSASDTANPWIALFRQIHDTHDTWAPFDNMTVYGMTAAYLFIRALQAAGPRPTRQSVITAVNSSAVNLGGPGLIPLDYSPASSAPRVSGSMRYITGQVDIDVALGQGERTKPNWLAPLAGRGTRRTSS